MFLERPCSCLVGQLIRDNRKAWRNRNFREIKSEKFITPNKLYHGITSITSLERSHRYIDISTPVQSRIP